MQWRRERGGGAAHFWRCEVTSTVAFIGVGVDVPPAPWRPLLLCNSVSFLQSCRALYSQCAFADPGPTLHKHFFIKENCYMSPLLCWTVSAKVRYPACICTTYHTMKSWPPKKPCTAHFLSPPSAPQTKSSSYASENVLEKYLHQQKYHKVAYGSSTDLTISGTWGKNDVTSQINPWFATSCCFLIVTAVLSGTPLTLL